MGNIFQLELPNLTRELGYLFAEIYIFFYQNYDLYKVLCPLYKK